MARVMPYYTANIEYPPEVRDVHHNHDDCKDGKQIKPEDHVSNSTGNKPLCKECIRLG